jgi:hypothetical protein
VRRHHAEYRRMQARVREPLDLVGKIFGGKLARSGLFEIGDRLDAAQRTAIELGVARRPVVLERESRMRLIADSGAQLDVVDAGDSGTAAAVRRSAR